MVRQHEVSVHVGGWDAGGECWKHRLSHFEAVANYPLVLFDQIAPSLLMVPSYCHGPVLSALHSACLPTPTPPAPHFPVQLFFPSECVCGRFIGNPRLVLHSTPGGPPTQRLS